MDLAPTVDPLSALPRTNHLTVAEREELGRAARKRRSRASLATWSAPADRQDPVSLLAGQETIRVQALLPLRHQRMAASAFAFYRGGAAIMAADLGTMPDSGLVTQLCGDAHLSNFGLFAAPDRRVVFDINDFDETNPGPFEWDVYRLAASFVLAGRDVQIAPEAIQAAALTASSAYRQQMAYYAGMPELQVYYDRIDIDVIEQWAKEDGLPGAKRNLARTAELARRRTSWSAVRKMTEVVDGHRRFLDTPPLLIRIPLDSSVSSAVTPVVERYGATLLADRARLLARYRIIDLAHKVVGVGSVGLVALVVLMEGRDPDDLLVLQVKQAVPSVLEPFTAPSLLETSGERVVVGQRLMQAATDSFLGWTVGGVQTRQYYVRQLRDMKYSIDPAQLTAQTLDRYALLCGRTLARAHARAGDPVAIAAYLGTSDKFDRSVLSFSLAYADQVESDYARYQAAIAAGSVTVETSLEPTYAVVESPESGLTLARSPDAASAGPASAGAADSSGTSTST